MESTKALVFGREPVVILALVEAIISTIVVFGFDLTTQQSAAIIVLAGAILTVIARQNVTPTTKLPEVVVGVQDAAGNVEPAVMKAEVAEKPIILGKQSLPAQTPQSGVKIDRPIDEAGQK
jgi:hypothetical protein